MKKLNQEGIQLFFSVHSVSSVVHSFDPGLQESYR
jgi:hypothetical protein